MAKLINTTRINDSKKTYLPIGFSIINNNIPELVVGQNNTSADLLLALEKQLRAEFAKTLAEKEFIALEKGKRLGYESGQRDTLDAQTATQKTALQSLNTLIDNLSKIENEISNQRKTLQKGCKQELLELVFDSVLKLLGNNFVLKIDTVEKIISPLLLSFSQNKRVQIKLSKADYAQLYSLEQEAFRNKFPNNLFIESHCGLEKSGVMVTSDAGELDLRLSTKLEQFKNLLIKQGDL